MAACTQQRQDSHEHDDAAATVVASTDVWGSVASAVAGGHATVKSIVTSAVADPHSFEATPADAAAIADASLVVYNGGGYDHWVDDVLADHPDVDERRRLLAAHTSAQPANEHVFYDPATAKAVAAQIADRLAEVDPGHADAYRANAAEFGKQADEIAASERAIGQAHPGAVGRGDRTRRALPDGQRRHHRQDPGGLRAARSRKTPTRPLPTWPPCST